jgi:hypothetical protein
MALPLTNKPIARMLTEGGSSSRRYAAATAISAGQDGAPARKIARDARRSSRSPARWPSSEGPAVGSAVGPAGSTALTLPP